ncbi:hypothetical protein GJ496_004463 [Pomphorhynchus laevis]|nr:hypothetical protein GJ496_004463 [Pomphorhynchus laevis]
MGSRYSSTASANNSNSECSAVRKPRSGARHNACDDSSNKVTSTCYGCVNNISNGNFDNVPENANNAFESTSQKSAARCGFKGIHRRQLSHSNLTTRDIEFLSSQTGTQLNLIF